MSPDPRALAERHGLSFYLEQRVPDHLTLVYHKQGCRPATEGETQLWTALARYALDREAAIARFVRAERLSDAARDLYEDWTSRHDPGSDYRSAGQDRLCNALAGLAMWADDEYDAARAALTLAPPRGAATGDGE